MQFLQLCIQQIVQIFENQVLLETFSDRFDFFRKIARINEENLENIGTWIFLPIFELTFIHKKKNSFQKSVI